jgi:isoquinoline 1-oxidoreductase beta subunit
MKKKDQPREKKVSDGAKEMDRREFLTTTAAVGGAMVLGFWLPPTAEAASGSPLAAQPWYRDAAVPEINAWITIAPDDTVTIRVGQTDIGSGVFTANPMMVAEELQCDWTKVRAEYASANRDFKEKAPEWTLKPPGNGETDPGGAAPASLNGQDGVYRRMQINSSGNVREGRYYLQQAGAEVRERLLLAAANEWGVPVTELVARNSVITHARSRRRTTYGAIAAKAARTPLPDPSRIRIKTPDKYTLLGTEQKSLEVPLKVTGEAIYGIDMRLPGMLYAAAKSCPVWGGDVRSFNFDAIRNMPGVHSAVRLPFNDLTRSVGDFLAGGVAVIADSWWRAQKALDALPIEWDYGSGAGVSSASLYDLHLAATRQTPGATPTNEGDVDGAMARAAKVVESVYSLPFSPRARMEPGNATVLVTDNRIDIWSGDQDPQGLLRRAAQLTNIAPENVYVHSTFQGGGYGSNGNGPQGEQAVWVANAVRGRPVKMLWTREEDWGSGTKYRPMSVCVMKAGLDADGWPIAMEVRHGTTWTGDMGYRGLSAPCYFIPNYRLSVHYPMCHVPIGTRRGTGAAANAFYQECFIDELANAAGKDPYMYRRELIARNPGRPRLGIGGFPHRDDFLKALDMAAKMSGWGTPLPEGWARGIAIDDRRRPTRTTSTICAEVVTVEVTRNGQLKLHRVDVAFEQGFAFMNPLMVKKQIEGQIAWAYDDTMYQATTIQDGRAVERSFDKFKVSRINEYPRQLNIQFLKTNRWITGAGEEAIPQLPPAILGAVFKITGKRLRSIPLKDHDLSWA